MGRNFHFKRNKEKTLPKTQQSAFEESLKRQGYTQDAENPKVFFKWQTNNSGVKIKKMIETTEGDEFVPKNIAARDALQTLASKKDLDPLDEVSSLRRLDEKLQDNTMLMGTFRDEQNDMEIFMSSVQDENGNNIEQDYGCFVWPRQKIIFKKKFDNGLVIRADETGYAVMKFSDTRFARLMWSFENKRTLHGELWEFKSGAYVNTNTFTATEIHPYKGDPVRYCD